MGNHAYLSAWPVDPWSPEASGVKPADIEGREFESRNLIPVFWLALFRPEDLRIDDSRDAEEAPLLVTPVATALSTLERRAAGLKEFVGETFAPLIDVFSALIRRDYAGLVVARLWELSYPHFGEHLRELLDAMTAFERGPKLTRPERETLDAMSGLHPDWKQSEWAVGILCGHAPDWPPAPGEAAWERAVAGHPTGDFRPYQVSTRWQVGDLLYHDKFGEGVVTKTVDHQKVEVLFRKESVALGSGLGAAPVPGPPTALDRYLAAPWDHALWETCRGELLATRDPRAAMLAWEEPRPPVDLESERWRRWVGPLQRFVDPDRLRFRRGFLDRVVLRSPRETLRRRPFLHLLGARRDTLLAHPFWRTVREVWAEDDDLLTICRHPNMVSLEGLSITPRGLSRLSQQEHPAKIRSVTSTSYGLEPEPAADWLPALSVGTLSSLVGVTLNLRELETDARELFSPASLAWLLASPLGQQLERLDLRTNGSLRYHLADWVPFVTRAGAPRRFLCSIAHGSTSVGFCLESLAPGDLVIHIETHLGFPGPDPEGDLPIVGLVSEVLAGLPAGTRGTHRHRSERSSEKAATQLEILRDIQLELFRDALAPLLAGGLVELPPRAKWAWEWA
jgi:hypothetical protein